LATRFKYALCLIGTVLITTLSVNAQFGEEDIINEADALFEQERFAEAMPLYSQLLSLNPTNPVFNYKYGATALYGDAEKKEEAVKYLKFAAGKPRVEDKCWYFLGRAYHLNYLFQDAITAYEKYATLASKNDLEESEVALYIEMAKSGKNLLSNIKEIKVLDRKLSPEESFFRIYDLADIGGKILVTPEELLSSEDKKRNHRSLIHFRGTGTTVYFSSYGKSGKNGLDIYHADVLPDGTFSEPVPVQGPINTPYDENYPYLHPDNRTFYFSSKGHQSMGGYDVFKAAYDPSTGAFSSPVNLDFAVNTPDDDLFYLADSLNEKAHFASSRSSKQGELYVYKVLVASAPLDVTFVKGSFFNEIEASKKLAKITVVDASNNQEVDVQYTDPATGDYVLSFSKGGRYKFLVEVKDGDKIHAGLVDIPSSKGATAYLQEMKLISSAGVEKLLINNLFDKTYQGDVLALAQKLLRQRAALDVNFDPSKDRVPEPGESIEKNPALAYSDAGFGAGMSNEAVLEQAEARVEELKDREIRAAQLALGAAEASESYFLKAEKAKSRADSLLQDASKYEGEERNKRMFLASLAKMDAKTALRKAENGKILKQELNELAKERESEYQAEKSRVDSLRIAIDSGDYDAIYAGLSEEKEIRAGIDPVEDRFEPIDDMRRKGLKAQDNAQNLLDRAQSLREQEEDLQASLITKRRQAQKMKGKDKEAMEEKVSALETDVESLKRKAERAFSQAEDAQELAVDEMERYELLAGIDEREDLARISEIEESEITWSAEEASLMAEGLNNLEIDEDEVRGYVQANPEVMADLESEGMAMAFRQNYLASDSGEGDLAMNHNTDPAQGENQSSESLETNTEPEVAERAAIAAETGDSEVPESQEADEVEEEIDYANDYDPNLPPEKRIEAEELKIRAATDWIAIIDESISQLSGGVGGEEGSEEQLQRYRALKTKKQEEIAERQANIDRWESELGIPDQEEALDRAMEDIDSLSPSYVARLESKIPEYSSEVSSMKSVSLIDRDYLPALAEIELSGLSDFEIAAKRIELNQELIASLDNILNEGISADVSNEEILEMRRVKALEVRQDQEIMDGSAEYEPRTVEAREYAELISPDEKYEEDRKAAESAELEEFSPAIAESLEQNYSKNLILPDYDDLIIQADLTVNPDLAAAQRIKVREDFLLRLTDEIALFKVAVESTDEPNLRVLERYNMLLAERSRTIDDLNADKAFLDYDPESAPQAEKDYQSLAESFQLSFNEFLNSMEEEGLDQGSYDSAIAVKDSLQDEVNSEIEALMALLDDPEADIDRDLVQAEVQELQALQTSWDSAISEMKTTDATAADLSEEETPAEAVDFDASDTETVVADTPDLQEVEREADFAEDSADLLAIEGISEGLLNEFQRQGKLENREGNLNELEKRNAAFLVEIESNIDSLESLPKSELSDQKIALIATELDELEALAADSRQEADRIQAELDVQSLAQAGAVEEREVIPTEETPDISGQFSTSAPKVAEIEALQYKSLNASIIRNSLIQKADSLEMLKVELSQTSTQNSEKREELNEEIAQLDMDISDGISRSNTAEIDYFRSENERLLTKSNPEYSTKREEILELQGRNRSLFESADGEVSPDDPDEQEAMLQELAEINDRISAIVEDSEEVVVPDSELASKILSPENHNRSEGKTYMTVMQREIENDLSADERGQLIKDDEKLQVKLDFAGFETVEEQRALIKANTKVDEIGLELLSETPLQLDYLTKAIKADSLKSLEKKSATHAENLQARAIELSKEADRLMKMAPEQKSKKDRNIIEERAEKLLAEAEVVYKRSALAAGQAEYLRMKRMDSERELSSISEKLSIRERKALNDLLYKPGYNVISSEPEELAESNKPENDEPETTGYPEIAEGESLADIKGNWLGMVEIIAEKTDFSDVDKTMFAEADASVYSDDNPIPLDPVMPDGLIFQVQVGAYRKAIPQDLFGAYAPLMGQKLNNGIIRYRAGLFKKYDQALEARDEIRSKGYSDAFVVAYVDGERLTGAQARSILDQAKEKASDDADLMVREPSSSDRKPTEDVVSDVENKPEYYNDPEAAEAKQVEVMTGLFYAVQVGVYSKPVKLAELFNLTELNSELTESGFIRYTTGRFVDIGEAQSRREVARSKGVSDAFITAYYNGKRISLNQAEELLKTEGNSILMGSATDDSSKATDEKPKTTYVVILGSFSNEIPSELTELFQNNEEWGIRKVEGEGGRAMYLSEELNSRDSAAKLLEECRALGINSAVIGEMIDGKIINTIIK